jgi:hypothetical protein
MNLINAVRYFIQDGKFVAPRYLFAGRRLLNDQNFLYGRQCNENEGFKQPGRAEIINFLISQCGNDASYLEIGVRNPDDNFNKINASRKYSVDPGAEFEDNPVDFRMTSDDFFSLLECDSNDTIPRLFDVVFIDGLHTAEQVDRDISNAYKYVTDHGFIVVHDCNPPTVHHAREDYSFRLTPANWNWNGTSWKGFMKWRQRQDVFSCTVDSDWGVGIISKSKSVGLHTTLLNEFYEYSKFDLHRVEMLGLVSFMELKSRIR